MKFLHLSDLHLGIRLMRRDLIPDQIHILDQVTDFIRQNPVDAILISGDIYDSSIPPAEAVSILDRFISGLHKVSPSMEICVISGNHDNPIRIDEFRSILSNSHIHMIGRPPGKPEDEIASVTLHDEYGDVKIHMLPFVKPGMVRKTIGDDTHSLSYTDAIQALLEKIRTEKDFDDARHILMSHQFYIPAGHPEAIIRTDSETIKIGNIDAVSADVLHSFDYVALGHIHNAAQVAPHIRYSGTPLAYSVSEADVEKGMILVEIKEKGNIEETFIPLTPLHKIEIRKGTLEELISSPSEEYIVAVLTTAAGIDAVDRLQNAFPNLLEIHAEYETKMDYTLDVNRPVLNPWDMCVSFLHDMTPEETEFLQSIFIEEEI